ncbi:hypothetical protein [Ferruginibacter profundus]
MKNKKKQIRKELSNKLIAAAMVHLDGLKKQKQKKIIRYLESKMGSVTNYYITLLPKKAKNNTLVAVPESEMQIVKSPEDVEMEINTAIINQAQ